MTTDRLRNIPEFTDSKKKLLKLNSNSKALLLLPAHK